MLAAKGYCVPSETCCYVRGLTVTSPDVKKKPGLIFIGTASPEQCSGEQGSVTVDVMYSGFYRPWHSPQVRRQVVFRRRLRAKSILSPAHTRTEAPLTLNEMPNSLVKGNQSV